MGGQRWNAGPWGWLLCLAWTLVACHDASEPPSGLGGESHFLMRCEDDDRCGDGLTCLAGLCTRACGGSASTCIALHPQAECLGRPDSDTDACEVTCNSDEDCSGTAGLCDVGLCRPFPRTSPEDVCSDDGCPAGGAGVPLCPPQGVQDSPAGTIEEMRIEGNKLHLTLRHGGGCERNEFVLCQQPEWGRLPVTAPLRLLGRVPGEGLCQGIEISELTFDLSRVEQRYRDDLGKASGVIRLSFGFWERYGFYAIGAPTCLERQATATQTLSSATAALASRCDVDADCLALSDETLCSSGCGALVSAEDLETWEGVIAIVDEQVCGLDAPERGCEPIGQPCPGSNNPPACIDGRCEYGAP